MISPGKEHFQEWLDRWSEPFLTNDFETFFEMCSLPMTIRSHGSEWTNSSKQEVEDGFNLYRDLIRNHGVTLIVRILRELAVLDERNVRLTYENYLMNNSIRAFAPSGAEAYLRLCDDGKWRARRVIEITFPDTNEPTLPSTRADKLHDTSLVQRLLRLRNNDDAGAASREDKDD